MITRIDGNDVELKSIDVSLMAEDIDALIDGKALEFTDPTSDVKITVHRVGSYFRVGSFLRPTR